MLERTHGGGDPARTRDVWFLGDDRLFHFRATVVDGAGAARLTQRKPEPAAGSGWSKAFDAQPNAMSSTGQSGTWPGRGSYPISTCSTENRPLLTCHFPMHRHLPPSPSACGVRTLDGRCPLPNAGGGGAPPVTNFGLPRCHGVGYSWVPDFWPETGGHRFNSKSCSSRRRVP